MKKLILLTVFAWQVVHAGTHGIRVLNAASFLENASLAPGAIISIFGPHLAATTASATDLSNLPHTLGGVTVSIGDTTLPLFYVTKTQINARIDPAIAAGAATLTIKSTTGTFTKDIVLSANSVPGVFSLTGSGTRDGAIQNAVTFALGPFSVTTKGAPTYLAIYTTGLDLSTKPDVTIGGVSVPVQFYGDAPCCPGLQQINVQLTPDLAGAGRVEVSVTSGGKTSNIVEAVILPNLGQGAFAPKNEGHGRSREIASLAYIPNTSFALLADENDDVIRVIDIQQKKVSNTIVLPEGSGPIALAVDASGKHAVAAERKSGKAALIDLTTNAVTSEVQVQSGPSAVAIAGNLAVVVNQDSDSVSVFDLTAQTVTNIIVGRGPRGVAVDAAANKAYVTNQDEGTVSVIDLSNLTAAPTILTLDANSRPAAIAIAPTLGLLVITEPSRKGKVILLPITGGAATAVDLRPAKHGGTSDVAIFEAKAYIANQSGGSVSVLPLPATGAPPASIKVDLGARALAIDSLDKLLLVSNQGSGTIVLVDLNTNEVVGRINAVRSEHEAEGEDHDDHDDRDEAKNKPAINSISPASANAGATFDFTITGKNLTGATGILFVDPATLSGHGHGNSGEHGQGGAGDTHVTVSNIQVSADGTQLTASVTIAADAAKGQRLVRVDTPNGDTTSKLSTANTFQIN